MPIVTKYVASKRKNQWGEYVVKAYLADGKRYPDADCFEAMREDADNTAKALNAICESRIGLADFSI